MYNEKCKRNKALAIMLSIAVLLLAFSVLGTCESTAANYQISKKTPSGVTFKADWAKTVHADSDRATFKYGFETYLLDEDFVQGTHKTKKCKVLVNDYTKSATDTAAAGKKAYADITNNPKQWNRAYCMGW